MLTMFFGSLVCGRDAARSAVGAGLGADFAGGPSWFLQPTLAVASASQTAVGKELNKRETLISGRNAPRAPTLCCVVGAGAQSVQNEPRRTCANGLCQIELRQGRHNETRRGCALLLPGERTLSAVLANTPTTHPGSSRCAWTTQRRMAVHRELAVDNLPPAQPAAHRSQLGSIYTLAAQPSPALSLPTVEMAGAGMRGRSSTGLRRFPSWSTRVQHGCRAIRPPSA